MPKSLMPPAGQGSPCSPRLCCSLSRRICSLTSLCCSSSCREPSSRRRIIYGTGNTARAREAQSQGWNVTWTLPRTAWISHSSPGTPLSCQFPWESSKRSSLVWWKESLSVAGAGTGWALRSFLTQTIPGFSDSQSLLIPKVGGLLSRDFLHLIPWISL